MKKINQLNTKPKTVQEYSCLYEQFREYFKIGVSDDFILLRDDFPTAQISPGDFSRLIVEMFQQNDEARHGK